MLGVSDLQGIHLARSVAASAHEITFVRHRRHGVVAFRHQRFTARPLFATAQIN
jgi:hypothetical protein